MKLIIIAAAMALIGTAVSAQTACFGLNCGPANEAQDDAFGDAIFDQAIMTSTQLGLLTPKRERCFQACSTRYNSETAQCRSMHDGWDDIEGRAICVQAVRDRYYECLNPIMQCSS